MSSTAAAAAATPFPEGTITFLFTDIEGSTRLWEAYPEAMRAAVARHDDVMREAIATNGGVVVKTVGDAFCAAFSTAPDALSAALSAQRGLRAEKWPHLPSPIRARVALYTGVAELRDGDYYGQAPNRVARLLSAAHGGQTLLSASTQELIRDHLPPGSSVKDLGEHRLRDLSRPERVYQLLHPDLPDDFAAIRSLDTLPNNLPRQVTSFIGREKEMADVKRLLGATALLTIVGTGGSGKTRLAQQVGADLLPEYTDGVWLAELAPLSDPALVPQTIAATLGVREEPGRTITQTLAEYLKSRRLLLLLDNAEHLLAACAPLAGALMRACPDLRLMVTSREGLGIAGETTYRIPSLSLPDPRIDRTPESLSQYEAVRLFIDRAAAVQPAFAVTNQNAPAVAQLCHRLDGIPLAIELAAARVRALSVEQIAARLDDRFRLLTGGSRTALPRQQTLRALIDWSYDLLSDSECVLLRRLSVFSGGWALEASEKVCADAPAGVEKPDALAPAGMVEEWEVIDLLTGLVDKSLVVYEEKGGAARYRLLETVRQYAADKLTESGEREAFRSRHRDYFLSVVQEARAKMEGPEAVATLDCLETEHDNLRAALDWAAQDASSEGGETGLLMASSLQRFWEVRGYLNEGRERLRVALSHPATMHTANRARGDALSGAGNLARNQGDYAAAKALHEESLSVRRAIDDRTGMMASLNNLGNVATAQGDYAAASALLEEALALSRELGNPNVEAVILLNVGFARLRQDHYEEAWRLLEAARLLCETLGKTITLLHVYGVMGDAARKQGDRTNARLRYRDCLRLCREVGDRAVTANVLENLADGVARPDAAAETQAAVDGSEQVRAVELLGAASALRERLNLQPDAQEKEEVERIGRALMAALGEMSFLSAFMRGREMGWEQAIEYALSEGEPAAGSEPE